MNAEVCDFGIFSDQDWIVTRCAQICQDFGFSKEIWNSAEIFIESGIQPRLVLASMAPGPEAMKLSEIAQFVKQVSKESFLIGVVPELPSKADVEFIKKSGCDLILMEEEVKNTCKLDYICSQLIQRSYLPVKASDLVVGQAVPFDLYHLLPLAQKFLKIIPKGGLITEGKAQKIKEVMELYIHRTQASEFSQYIQATTSSSAEGITKRCRYQFLELSSSFLNLVTQLTNKSSPASFQEGQKLLDQCQGLCSKLIGLLAESGEAWQIINNSAVGDFGSVERSPAIAAYCGLFGLQMGWDNVDKLMLAALISDIGVLYQSPAIAKALREQNISSLSSSLLENFKTYPLTSLQLLLDRKLSVDEKLRNVIVSSRERMDGKGFPKGNSGDRIPIESRLIAFARHFDQNTLVRMGSARRDPKETLKELVKDLDKAADAFGLDLLANIKQIAYADQAA